MIETEGYESAISFYVYGLVGASALTLISPLIVFSVPILMLLAPPALAWWRGRHGAPRVGSPALWWLIIASTTLSLAPLATATWFVVVSDHGPPPESFWLIVIALFLLPFPMSTTMYLRRTRPRRNSDFGTRSPIDSPAR